MAADDVIMPSRQLEPGNQYEAYERPRPLPETGEPAQHESTEESRGRDGFEPRRVRREPDWSPVPAIPDHFHMNAKVRLRSRPIAAAPPQFSHQCPMQLLLLTNRLPPILKRSVAIEARGRSATADDRMLGASDLTKANMDWTTAYEAAMAAQILFVRKFGPSRANAQRRRSLSPCSRKLTASFRPTRAGPREPGAPAVLDSDRDRLRRRHGRWISRHLVLEPSGRHRASSPSIAELAGRHSMVLNEIADIATDVLNRCYRLSVSPGATRPHPRPSRRAIRPESCDEPARLSRA